MKMHRCLLIFQKILEDKTFGVYKEKLLICDVIKNNQKNLILSYDLVVLLCHHLSKIDVLGYHGSYRTANTKELQSNFCQKCDSN